MRIARLIEIQMTLRREDRISAEDLLSIITNDVASLRESEPAIHQSIIRAFNQKYSKDLTSKPSIVNGLTDIRIYQPTKTEASIQVAVPVEDDTAASVSPTIATSTDRQLRREWKR
jgi:hypothetical protein